MESKAVSATPDIHFMRITVTTMNQICDLSKTLSPLHHNYVADNVRSIAKPYQGKGYGKRALEKLIRHLKAMGLPLLYTSCGQGEGSPKGFYRKLGFNPTGDHYGHEIELVLQVDTYALP